MNHPNPQRDADLIRRLGPGLVLFARQWCRSGEDVVQDAFLQLFRQQVHPENVSAWLYRVVRHDAMNAGRADSRRFRHECLASENREVWFDPAPGQTLDIETITDSLRA